MTTWLCPLDFQTLHGSAISRDWSATDERRVIVAKGVFFHTFKMSTRNKCYPQWVRLTSSAILILIVGSVFGQPAPKKTSLTLKPLRETSKRHEIKCKVPVFGGGGLVARLANRTIALAIQEDVKMLKSRVAEDWAEKDHTPPAPYFLGIEPDVSLATDQLISLHLSAESFTGGAHGSLWLPAYNFGIVKGKPKKLTLQDLFLKSRDANDIVSRIVIAELRENGASSATSGGMTELSEHQANNFVISKKGLTFLFEPYSAGSWAEGMYMIEVPFSKLYGNLDPNGPLKSLFRKR